MTGRSLLIGLTMLVELRSQARASCRPTALVRGPAALVAAINRTLAARGVASEIADGCPFVRADVWPAASGLAVTIEDAYGRVHDHTVGDAEVAATLIESWIDLHQEAPLLAARGAPPPAPVAMRDDELPAVVHARPELEPALALSASFETALASDGSSWWGAGAGACVRFGLICAGARTRLTSDARWSGTSEQLESGRTALDLMLAIEVPSRRRGASVSWGAGLGLGWLRTSASGPAGAIDIDGGGLRADLHLATEVPITRTIAVELGGGLAWSPLAHVARYSEDGITLAGEPRGFARVSLGVRYGARR